MYKLKKVVGIPITFNTSIEAYFSNFKYHVIIQTHPTQFVKKNTSNELLVYKINYLSLLV